MDTLNKETNQELNLERINLNASDSEEELGDEWAYPYGGNKERILTFIMAGGSSGWWNYVLRFPESDDENYTLYIENKEGLKEIEKFLVMKMRKDGCQYLKEVDSWKMDDYEYADDESPIIYYE
jgi:hypothetical protein